MLGLQLSLGRTSTDRERGASRRLSTPAATTSAEIESQVEAVIDRADSIVMGEVITRHNGRRATIPVFCSLEECRYDASGARPRSTGAQDLATSRTTYSPTGEFAGVPTAKGQSTVNIFGFEVDVLLYGGWLRYSAFTLLHETVVKMPPGGADAIGLEGSAGLSFGAATGQRPAGSATWTDAMTAGDAGRNEPALMRGRSNVTYRLDRATLDVSFTEIEYLAGGAHPDMNWREVPVDRLGGFKGGPPQRWVRGRFYVPAVSEAAGVFRHSAITGAFGAKR